MSCDIIKPDKPKGNGVGIMTDEQGEQVEASDERPVLRVRSQRLVRARICDVKPNAANHRTHPQDQRRAFRKTVDKLGFYGYPDIFVNSDGDYELFDGELRWSDIAETYGENTEIEWNLVDFDDAEARLAMASKDAVASLAGVNTDKWVSLREQIKAERQGEDGIEPLLERYQTSWALTYQQRAQMLARQQAAAAAAEPRPDDEELEPEERAERNAERNQIARDAVQELGVARGQLWTLSKDGMTHRLYIGDSKRRSHVGVLLQGRTAEVLVTDPPYCSGGFQESGRSAGTWGEIASDNLGTSGYVQLIRSVLETVQPQAVYMFCDWRQWSRTADVIEAEGVSLRSLLVWAKGSPALGGLWRCQHEVIIFASRAGSRREVGRAAVGNVLNADRSGNRWHYTEKPVDLLRQIIGNESQSGREGLIYDPFGGSLTTVLAGHVCGRTVAAMELEPMAAGMGLVRARNEGFELDCEAIEAPENWGNGSDGHGTSESLGGGNEPVG